MITHQSEHKPNTMENTINPNTPPIAEDEIDLIALAKTLWQGRKTVIKTLLIGAVLGLVVALLSPKEYTSTTVMVPQLGKSSSKLGGLSSLAAMAGFNLDNISGSNDVLSPMVYPQIINSSPFQLELMNQPFHFDKVDHPISIYQYYTEIKKPGVLSYVKKYTIGLPGVILGVLKSKPQAPQTTSNLLALTEKQEAIRNFISANISLNVNSKVGYLSLTANMEEPALAAEVAQFARELLQKYITQLKIEKANQQLKFINDRYTEKKIDFERTQENLARFRDQNKNVSLALAKTEEERLQSEYTIAFNVYSELAKQLEQAQIQVKEETPVFSVLSPAVIPNQKSKPKKSMILMMWMFLGTICGIGIVFGKEYLVAMKKKWNELE